MEHFAPQPQEEATLAVQDATAGAWRNALEHAEQTQTYEFLTGRTVSRGTPTTWQPLVRAVVAAMPARGGCSVL